MNRFDYTQIPNYMHEGLLSHINDGTLTGDFLTSVLEGDLFRACSHADDINVNLLPVYTAWLHNIAPSGCFGSSLIVLDWQKRGGLKGLDLDFAPLTDEAFTQTGE